MCVCRDTIHVLPKAYCVVFYLMNSSSCFLLEELLEKTFPCTRCCFGSFVLELLFQYCCQVCLDLTFCLPCVEEVVDGSCPCSQIYVNALNTDHTGVYSRNTHTCARARTHARTHTHTAILYMAWKSFCSSHVVCSFFSCSFVDVPAILYGLYLYQLLSLRKVLNTDI